MGMTFNIVGMFIAIYAIDKYGLQVSIENYVTWHWNETEKVGGEESGSGKELGRKKGGKTAEQDSEKTGKAEHSKRKVRGDGTPVKLMSSTHACMWCWFRFHLVRIQISLFAKGIRSRSKPHLCDWFRIEAKWRGSRSFAIKFTLKL